jgi:hypothetical protein
VFKLQVNYPSFHQLDFLSTTDQCIVTWYMDQSFLSFKKRSSNEAIAQEDAIHVPDVKHLLTISIKRTEATSEMCQ